MPVASYLPNCDGGVVWSSAMELVFIRHGQPEWVRDGLNVENPPLTELGRRQAVNVAEALSNEHFDEVLVSPLIRARQTASPLLAAQNRPEEIAPWLQEIGDPAWHGTPAAHAQEQYKELMARPSHERWTGLEGGESVRGFADRISSGVTSFMAERGGRRSSGDLPVWHLEQPDLKVALVAHIGTNSMALGQLLGIDPVPWQWERFQLFHASITRLETFELGDGHAFGLSYLGNADHLAVADRTR